MREIYKFSGAGKCELTVSVWKPEGECKMVMHVLHGMTEHMGRYNKFAEYLVKKGVLVIGMDLRGHGLSKGDKSCASLGEGGWEDTLKDIKTINSYIKETLNDIPVVMLGFSLGSFILRDYMSLGADEVSAVIIAGSGSQPSIALSVLKKIVKGQIKKGGYNNTTSLVRKLSFETYNKMFAPNKTKADWLCSDDFETDAYINDELSRSDISSGLFYMLLSKMDTTGKIETYNKWNKDIHVLLISGECDPVGDKTKGVLAIGKMMEKAGLNNVKVKFIKDSRHDIFHEYKNGGADILNDEVVEFIKVFI